MSDAHRRPGAVRLSPDPAADGDHAHQRERCRSVPRLPPGTASGTGDTDPWACSRRLRVGKDDVQGQRTARLPSRIDRLPAALLAYAIALAVLLLVPPYLKAAVGPPEEFTLQEATDLLTPLVIIPLAWLVLDLTGGLGRRGLVAFLVVAALWVEGQGIHLRGERDRRRVPARHGRGLLPDRARRSRPVARRDAEPLDVARGVGRARDPDGCRGDARPRSCGGTERARWPSRLAWSMGRRSSSSPSKA